VFSAGFLLSNISVAMQAFGLGWLVVQLAVQGGTPERAPLYLGLVGIARAIPGLALGLFGGVVADRRDRRTLLLATQGSYAAIATTLAVLTLSGLVTIVWVLALSALVAATSSFYHPTRQALQPRLVGERNLMSAFGLNTLSLNVGTLTGPLLGGLLIGPLTVGGVLLGSAILYAAAALIYLTLAPQPAAVGARHARVVAALVEGLRYVRDEPMVRWLMLLFAATTLCARPYADLLPAFARSISVDAVGLAQMAASVGAGSLFAGFITASSGSIARKGLAVIGGVIATGITLIVFSLQTTLLPALATIVVLSFFLMTASGIVGALVQLETPDHLRGRVVGVQNLLIEGGLPVGTLALGSLGTAFGIGPALAIGGALLAAAGLAAAIFVPALRRSDSVRDSAHA
jgi:MFS family permease